MRKLNLGVFKRLRGFAYSLNKFIVDDIESHREDLDRENPRDYVDHYLIEQEKDEDFTGTLNSNHVVAPTTCR